MDGLYEIYSRPDPANRTINAHDTSRTRPTELLPTKSSVLDVEYAKPDDNIDPTHKHCTDTPPKNRHVYFDLESAETIDTQHSHEPDDNQNSSGTTNAPPPPRDDSNEIVNHVRRPSINPHERDWERLRKYFAWLPKLVIQKTF